jgi:hypothetical protein
VSNAKGSAKNPKLVFSHCHPICSVEFEQEQAVAAVYEFVEEVEAGRWSWAKSPESRHQSDDEDNI